MLIGKLQPKGSVRTRLVYTWPYETDEKPPWLEDRVLSPWNGKPGLCGLCESHQIAFGVIDRESMGERGDCPNKVLCLEGQSLTMEENRMFIWMTDIHGAK
jgi:hypothetical protein